MTVTHNRNVFSLSSQVGGPDAAVATEKDEQQLRDAMNQWTGDYCTEIRKFAFLLRVDGAIHAYTREWNIRGAQKAKRKKDWVEIEIGIPEDWWRKNEGAHYKEHLIAEMEKGLHSMIELLQSKQYPIKAKELLADWEKIKKDYLDQDSKSPHIPDPYLANAMALLKEMNTVHSVTTTPLTKANQPLRLYKADLFWEAWYTADRVTIHWGRLGEQGQTREIYVQPGVDSHSIVEHEARQSRTEGYREILQLSRLTIQYPIEGMGTVIDVDKRHEIEHLVDSCLGSTGLGHCDGGDIGSGTMNVFCFVVNAERVLQIIVEELKKNGLLQGAKIILRSDEDEDKVLFSDGSRQYTH
jgi:hypothetical protein